MYLAKLANIKSMEQYNMHEAKSQLSKLVARAQKGEKIIIAKGGKPVVVIRKFEPPMEKRTGGVWKGRIKMSEDFDAFGPELQELFGIKD